MTDLDRSYPKTLALLEQDKVDEALSEYRTGCLAAVKKLYSESAKVYPLRFSKAKAWCTWTKTLYVMSLKIEKALAAKDVKTAKVQLILMRAHFYELHQQVETLGGNDWIYAFHQEACKEAPSVTELKRIATGLAQATPGIPARTEKGKPLYVQAKTTWLQTVDPLLKQEVLSASDLTSLRQATAAFYQAYGQHFE